MKTGPGRCATLGRIKTLEMTECQKQKMMNDANNRSNVSNYITFRAVAVAVAVAVSVAVAVL